MQTQLRTPDTSQDRFDLLASPKWMRASSQVRRSFATAVGCVEGDVADAASHYLRRELGIRGLYPVRCSAPLALLAGRGDPRAAAGVREQILRSSRVHGSSLIAVVAHTGCASCPGAPDEQIADLCESVERISGWGLGVEPVGLWVDENGDIDWLA